jgi:hypothetical protein
MKIRIFLASLLLLLGSSARADVTDSELDFVANWGETFSGPTGIVADIFTPPWFFYSVLENDPSGVEVSSGGFDGKIVFGATRRFDDAVLAFSVFPHYTLEIRPVPGDEFAAEFHGTFLPESSTRWIGLLCLAGVVTWHHKRSLALARP